MLSSTEEKLHVHHSGLPRCYSKLRPCGWTPNGTLWCQNDALCLVDQRLVFREDDCDGTQGRRILDAWYRARLLRRTTFSEKNAHHQIL